MNVKTRTSGSRNSISKTLSSTRPLARENSGWGYDRIVGALANLGYTVSDQTASNILRRHGIAPAPRRSRTMSWKDFLAAHLETRRITIAGITPHPDGEWMEQIARSATQESWGYLSGCRYVLHDRDKKFCASFRSVLTAAGVKPVMLPAKSPNLNAYAERWVRSMKQECLSKTDSVGRSVRCTA